MKHRGYIGVTISLVHHFMCWLRPHAWGDFEKCWALMSSNHCQQPLKFWFNHSLVTLMGWNMVTGLEQCWNMCSWWLKWQPGSAGTVPGTEMVPWWSPGLEPVTFFLRSSPLTSWPSTPWAWRRYHLVSSFVKGHIFPLSAVKRWSLQVIMYC